MSLARLRRKDAPAPPPRAAGGRGFLPTTRAELEARGYGELDILIVTGDAYVDHAAFGPVLIARFLEARGYRVGIIAQPRWDDPSDIARMGAPRLFVGVSAGNLDSMLNKLTAQKKVRGEDQYSPGGRTGLRPNRATLVYANLCRRAFPGVPVVLGGIEASLRRIAHYDYWADAVRRSILLDSKADLLVFGMGERAAWEIARRLDAGERVEALRDVRGTGYALGRRALWEPLEARRSRHVGDGGVVVLPSYEEVASDDEAFARMTRAFQLETNPHNARPILQVHGGEAVYFNPPALPLEEALMDELYDLPFVRAPHPSYGGERIPAFDTVRDSIVTMRGCFGGCTFCSITEHEGRIIQSRSQDSVLREIRALSRSAGFSGVLSDVGGPTANMYQMRCKDARTEQACRRLSCVHPKVCDNLNTDHGPLIELLQAAREEPGIKRVFVASGVRYDLASRSPEFIAELARHHTGGQLSVAPEHTDKTVLRRMKKPDIEHYERFVDSFCEASAAAGKDQYLVPYFIVGHPGSTLTDTIELARWLKQNGMRPRQIQEFIPTPMSVATAMYRTGIDPLSGERVPVVRDLREKRMMKALLGWWNPAEWSLAREALERAGRRDLIGNGAHCLIPPPWGSTVPAGSAPPRGGGRGRTVSDKERARRSPSGGGERRR